MTRSQRTRACYSETSGWVELSPLQPHPQPLATPPPPPSHSPSPLQSRARNESLLSAMQLGLAASQRELRQLRLRVAKYSEAYQASLKEQGLAPDHTVSAAVRDASLQDQAREDAARREEMAQIGLQAGPGDAAWLHESSKDKLGYPEPGPGGLRVKTESDPGTVAGAEAARRRLAAQARGQWKRQQPGLPALATSTQ